MKPLTTLGLAAALLTGNAFASVTYEYVGNDFTVGPDATGPINPAFGTRITALVEFTDEVTPDFTGFVNSGSAENNFLLSYEISSGPITFVSGDVNSGPITNIQFIFDNGEIISWIMGIISADNHTYLLTLNDGILEDFASNNLNSNVNGNFSFDPGTWTRVAPVPVPAAVWLLGSACGLLSLRRRLEA